MPYARSSDEMFSADFTWPFVTEMLKNNTDSLVRVEEMPMGEGYNRVFFNLSNFPKITFIPIYGFCGGMDVFFHGSVLPEDPQFYRECFLFPFFTGYSICSGFLTTGQYRLIKSFKENLNIAPISSGQNYRTTVNYAHYLFPVWEMVEPLMPEELPDNSIVTFLKSLKLDYVKLNTKVLEKVAEKEETSKKQGFDFKKLTKKRKETRTLNEMFKL